jgi:hypothetical protein
MPTFLKDHMVGESTDFDIMTDPKYINIMSGDNQQSFLPLQRLNMDFENKVGSMSPHDDVSLDKHYLQRQKDSQFKFDKKMPSRRVLRKTRGVSKSTKFS